jgi:hypothetical protein
LLTLLTIPVGLFIGSQLANLIVRASSTESVRLPLVLKTQPGESCLKRTGSSFATVSAPR